MKNTVDSNPVRDAIDMPGLLARIARLEVEIGSIRQELVHSLGGPRLAFNADEVENEDEGAVEDDEAETTEQV